jgi:hypothetical protein
MRGQDERSEAESLTTGNDNVDILDIVWKLCIKRQFGLAQGLLLRAESDFRVNLPEKQRSKDLIPSVAHGRYLG